MNAIEILKNMLWRIKISNAEKVAYLLLSVDIGAQIYAISAKINLFMEIALKNVTKSIFVDISVLNCVVKTVLLANKNAKFNVHILNVSLIVELHVMIVTKSVPTNANTQNARKNAMKYVTESLAKNHVKKH